MNQNETNTGKGGKVIGAEIKRVRMKELGMSREQLAVAVGVDVSTIARWENGDSKPGVNNALALSYILRRPIDLFL